MTGLLIWLSCCVGLVAGGPAPTTMVNPGPGPAVSSWARLGPTSPFSFMAGLAPYLGAAVQTGDVTPWMPAASPGGAVVPWPGATADVRARRPRALPSA